MSKKMVYGIAGIMTAVMLMISGVVALVVLNQSAAAVPMAQVQAAPASPAQAPINAPAGDSAPQAAFSPDVAAQIAMNAAPGTQLTKTPELVSFNGTVAYEVVLNQGTVYVDASSGKILSNSVPQVAGGNGQFGGRGGEGSERSGGQNPFGGLFGGDHDD